MDLWDQWDSDWNSTESLVYRQNVNKEAEKSPIIGFLPDLSKLKNEQALVSAENEKWEKQFKYASYSNYDSKYKEMKKAYTDAGLYKIVDEFNKQYKEWKKK